MKLKIVVIYIKNLKIKVTNLQNIYNASSYELQKIIIKKLIESIGKPKGLRKTLGSLGFPKNDSSCEVSALKIKKKFDGHSVLEDFRNYYSTLAEKLVKLAPKPINK